MSTGLSLLKLLLNNKFYVDNHHRITEDLFPAQLHSLLDTLSSAHVKYNRDLQLNELYELHISANPTLTYASKQEIQTVLDNVKGLPEIAADAGNDIIRAAHKQELARKAADALLGIAENKEANLEEIKSLVTAIETEDYEETTTEYVGTEIEALVDDIASNYKWRFNIPALASACGNIGAGTLGIVTAVPDGGKTCFMVNLVFGRDGFLNQGAKVHYIGNEEPAQRTMLRGVNCFTGIPTRYLIGPEMVANRAKAQAAFDTIRGNIFIQNSVDMTIDKLDRYCKDKKPDILIIDQLDKLKIQGFKDGNDVAKLAAIYAAVREIAKRRAVAILGVCQAGDGAQGKLYYGYDDLYGSKTMKAGEADYILCLGMAPKPEGNAEQKPGAEGFRMINIAKNKSPGGNKNPIGCQFDLELSRVVA